MFQGPISQLLPWAVPALLCLVACAFDVRSRRIPQRIVALLLLGGLVWSTASGVAAAPAGATTLATLGHAAMGLASGLLGMLVAGGPFFILWALGGGGAGDAKLMFAVGAWVGPGNAVVLLLAVALAGGLLSIGYGLARGQLTLALGNVLAFSNGMLLAARSRGSVARRADLLPKLERNGSIPYGVAILVGTCAAAAWVTV